MPPGILSTTQGIIIKKNITFFMLTRGSVMQYSDRIVYGIHPVKELLKSRLTSVDHVYFEKGKKGETLFELMKLCRKERLAYNLLPEVRLRQITGSASHQGIAAACSVRPYLPVESLREKLRNRSQPLMVLPASIEDPGNLGAVIRSAVALEADALLLERKHTAPLSAAVAKSSAGMLEHIDIVRPRNLEGVCRRLIAEGYKMVGADMKKGAAPRATDLTGPLILVIGGEHRGIPPYLSKLCAGFISIPMSSRAQSLNVSATAAILLYEISRQRTALQTHQQ